MEAEAERLTARRLTILGAPHPATHSLFQQIEAILSAEPPPGFLLELVTTPKEVEGHQATEFIYLRSEAADALAIAAAMGSALAVSTSYQLASLDAAWRDIPCLSVEMALLHPGYLAATLSERLNTALGPMALQRAEASFNRLAREGVLYTDPLGYLDGFELEPADMRTPRGASLICETLTGRRCGAVIAGEIKNARVKLARLLGEASAVAYPLWLPGAFLAEAELDSSSDAVCLIDLADDDLLLPMAERLYAALPPEGVLCGVEPSVEALRRLMSRCTEFGRRARLTFVTEGSEWKAAATLREVS